MEKLTRELLNHAAENNPYITQKGSSITKILLTNEFARFMSTHLMGDVIHPGESLSPKSLKCQEILCIFLVQTIVE